MVAGIPSVDEVWSWLAEVPDPEIPALSVVDLGIVRDVRVADAPGGADVVVTVTPTYSGCPATEVIAGNILGALRAHGLAGARLETRLSPAWTTDWISAAGREKLRAFGIAPPSRKEVACPRCGSLSTRLVSLHGSTPCKALYACKDCLEPFDAFKCH
jgi:ring-1,2-phenylacetyl-CoA epoxidase subunit PaaD